MNEIIKKDALEIINGVIEILKVKEEKDVQEIKNLSNHTIHNASVFQDECSVSIAVVVYALSKIIARNPEELNYSRIIKMLEKAKDYLANDNESGFHSSLKSLFSEISRIDSKLKLYVREVINEAQIKKGSKLCEHGLSCAQASQIMNISQWELMNYLGNTELHEQVPDIVNVKSRLKFTRSLFQ